MVEQIRSMGVTAPAVLHAMREVPRDRFVPDDLKTQAWDNRPLPIGFGQTISQPYTVAYMMELVGVRSGDRVLEVGAGCGYAAAVAGAIVGSDGLVIGVEIRDELASRANRILAALGYDHVKVESGDGRNGEESKAPFDRIVVSATAPEVPKSLVTQLAVGGALVMPVKTGFSSVMTRILRTESGLKESSFGLFDFVSLV